MRSVPCPHPFPHPNPSPNPNPAPNPPLTPRPGAQGTERAWWPGVGHLPWPAVQSGLLGEELGSFDHTTGATAGVEPRRSTLQHLWCATWGEQLPSPQWDPPHPCARGACTGKPRCGHTLSKIQHTRTHANMHSLSLSKMKAHMHMHTHTKKKTHRPVLSRNPPTCAFGLLP